MGLSHIGDNILVILIIFGFGYLIYAGMKSTTIKSKIESAFKGLK